MTDPTVTVAIATYLRDGVLVDTLRQVLAQQPQPDEIIVVDQTPIHGASTLAYLKDGSSAGLFRWIQQKRPSLTMARNRALVEAKGEIVLFIDDDVWLPDGFIQAHVACHATWHVDIVSGPVKRSVEEPLTVDELPTSSPKALAMTVPPNYGRPWHGIPKIHGNNHSVRKQAAIATGGYDEHFLGPALCEDTDFAFRAVACGFSIGYEPTAWLVHLAAPSGGCRIPGSSSWKEWEKSMTPLLFALRHSTNARLPWAVYGTLAKMALRAGPLRRENVLHFWRQPYAWASLLYAWFVAHKYVEHGVESPFVGRRYAAARQWL